MLVRISFNILKGDIENENENILMHKKLAFNEMNR